MSNSEVKSRWGATACISFSLAVWLFATFFFFGDIGPWNDDYFFTQRDPVSGEIARWVLTTRDPYLEPTGHLNALRPWLHTVIPAILSIFWDHFWAAHLVGAIGHGLAGLFLYRILRGLGRSVHASGAAALFFIAWGVHHEAYLWVSAYGTLFSSLIFLGMVLCVLRLARGGGWWWGAAIPLGAIGVLGFQEQASGAFPALMLAYWAACPNDELWRRRLLRPGIPVAAACALVPVYLYFCKRFAQPGLGNTDESYEPLAGIPKRVFNLGKGFIRNIGLKDFSVGPLKLGGRALQENWPLLAVWVVVFVVLGYFAWRAWCTTPMHGFGSPPRRPARVWAVTLFGLAAFVGSTLTIAVIRGYQPLSRVTYLPFASLLIAASPLLDGIARLFHPLSFVPGAASPEADRLSAWYRRLTGAGLGALLILGGVLSIGAASRMRQIVQLDEANGRRLKELLPNPRPGTVFLPTGLRPLPFKTRQAAFNYGISSVWERLWSMKFFIKFVYGRDDVWSLGACHGLPILMDADQEKAVYIWPFGVPYYDPATDRAPIPWEFIVPIAFDERGEVRIVTTLVQPRRDAPPLLIDVPQAKGQPELRIEMPPLP